MVTCVLFTNSLFYIFLLSSHIYQALQFPSSAYDQGQVSLANELLIQVLSLTAHNQVIRTPSYWTELQCNFCSLFNNGTAMQSKNLTDFFALIIFGFRQDRT